MLEYLSIGQIINTHGVKGEIKIYPLTNDASRFENLKEVFVESSAGLKKYEVLYAKMNKNIVILKLKNIDTMNEAEKLKGLYIKVHRSNAVKLPENSYFICDLINCIVYDVEYNKIGILTDVLQTGSNDVYVVKSEDMREILIPALKSVVKDIDVENKKILVDLPEGLI